MVVINEFYPNDMKQISATFEKRWTEKAANGRSFALRMVPKVLNEDNVQMYSNLMKIRNNLNATISNAVPHEKLEDIENCDLLSSHDNDERKSATADGDDVSDDSFDELIGNFDKAFLKDDINDSHDQNDDVCSFDSDVDWSYNAYETNGKAISNIKEMVNQRKKKSVKGFKADPVAKKVSKNSTTRTTGNAATARRAAEHHPPEQRLLRFRTEAQENRNCSESIAECDEDQFTTDFGLLCRSAESFIKKTKSINENIINVDSMLNHISDLSLLNDARVTSSLTKLQDGKMQIIAEEGPDESQEKMEHLQQITPFADNPKAPNVSAEVKANLAEKLSKKISKMSKKGDVEPAAEAKVKKPVPEKKVPKKTAGAGDVLTASGSNTKLKPSDPLAKLEKSSSKTRLSNDTRPSIRKQFLDMENRIVQQATEKIRPPNNTPTENGRVSKANTPVVSRPSVSAPKKVVMRLPRFPTPKKAFVNPKIDISAASSLTSVAPSISLPKRRRLATKCPPQMQKVLNDIKIKKIAKDNRKIAIPVTVINL